MSRVALRKRGTQRVSSGGLTLAAIPLIVDALAACFFLSDAFARPSLASFPRQIRDTLSDRSLAYSLASQLALSSYLV